MPSPVTEIAYISLKPGVELEGSGPAAKAWQETLTTVQDQDGSHTIYYGRTLEDATLLMLFIDWESHDSHLKFIASPQYGPFKEKLGSIMDGVHLHHIAFSPFPPKILSSAPIIEFASFFDTTPELFSNVPKFLEAVGIPDGCFGGAYGQSVESDVVKHADGSAKGKAVVLCIGWESKDAHMRFRETDVFAKNIGLLSEGAGAAEMFHVPFKTV